MGVCYFSRCFLCIPTPLFSLNARHADAYDVTHVLGPGALPGTAFGLWPDAGVAGEGVSPRFTGALTDTSPYRARSGTGAAQHPGGGDSAWFFLAGRKGKQC